MVSLQSCKDDLSDFEHRYDTDKGLTDQELINLWNYVKYGDDSLDDRVKKLEEFREQLMAMDPNAPGISDDVKEFLQTFLGYGDDIDELSKALWGAGYDQPGSQKNGGLTGDVNEIWNVLGRDPNNGLQKLVKDIDNIVTNDQWGNEALYKLLKGDGENIGLEKRVEDLEGLISGDNGIEDKIDAINKLLNGADNPNSLQAQIDAIKEELQKKLEAENHTEIWEAINKLNNETIPEINKKIEAAEERLDFVEASLEDLRNRVANLESKVEALVNRIDKLITGILVQRAFGPVFGDFSLPIGVQSNLLFGWYGEKTSPIKNFPTAKIEDNLEDDLFNGFVSSVDVADLYYGSDIDLGRLFMTINPVGHNFTDTKLSLENSKGEKLEAVKVVPTKSDYLLSFGSSRAQATVDGNGFYEAKMSIAYDNLADIEVTLNKDDMKDAVKGILNDPSTASAAKLLKVVYDQVNNSLQSMPAYAVCYNWSAQDVDKTKKTEQVVYDENGKPVYNNDGTPQTITVETRDFKDYSVRSKYEVGVATAHPLSYNTLKGEGSSKTVPTIGNLDNFIDRIKDKISSKFNVNATTEVKGNSVSIESVSISGTDQLTATITGLKINGAYPVLGRMVLESGAYAGNKPGEILVPCGTEPSEVVAKVNDAIVDVLCHVVGMDDTNPNYKAFKAEANIKVDAVLLQMNQQINSIISDLKANVESIFDVEGNNYFKRVNKMFDLYNKVANKINKFLANPNAALQVAAFYDAKGGIERLSQKAESPTVVEGTGSMKLYLTNYTGEFIVPACKKFVGVKYEAGNVVAEQLLDGNETEYVFNVPSTKGVYQIVYQGLDYSGYTSTKTFYIEVK